MVGLDAARVIAVGGADHGAEAVEPAAEERARHAVVAAPAGRGREQQPPSEREQAGGEQGLAGEAVEGVVAVGGDPGRQGGLLGGERLDLRLAHGRGARSAAVRVEHARVVAEPAQHRSGEDLVAVGVRVDEVVGPVLGIQLRPQVAARRVQRGEVQAGLAVRLAQLRSRVAQRPLDRVDVHRARLLHRGLDRRVEVHREPVHGAEVVLAEKDATTGLADMGGHRVRHDDHRHVLADDRSDLGVGAGQLGADRVQP